MICSVYNSPFNNFLHAPFSLCRNGACFRLAPNCQPLLFCQGVNQYVKQNTPRLFKSKFKIRFVTPFYKFTCNNELLACATKFLSCATKTSGKTMSNEYVSISQKMANFLITNEFKGAGDTIEAAAYRVQTKWRAPASILLRLRHRAHEMKDMKVSSWFSVFEAYQRACTKAAQKIAKSIFDRLPFLVITQKLFCYRTFQPSFSHKTLVNFAACLGSSCSQ